MDFAAGAKSGDGGVTIYSIFDKWKPGWEKMLLNVDIKLQPESIKSVRFYDEAGNELKVNNVGDSRDEHRLRSKSFTIKGEFPAKGRIVFEVLDI